MSQSCFSLGYLSQNSLWKLSTFRGYKGYLYLCKNRMRRVKPWANWMASLDFLSCNATVGMTVQLLCMLHSCASFGGLPITSHPRDPVTSPYFNVQSWAFLHSLSHTTLTWFSPKCRVSKCWITSKLARNKANKMVN